jgi:hypothetical protein
LIPRKKGQRPQRADWALAGESCPEPQELALEADLRVNGEVKSANFSYKSAIFVIEYQHLVV